VGFFLNFENIFTENFNVLFAYNFLDLSEFFVSKLSILILSCSCFFPVSVMAATQDHCEAVVDRYMATLEQALAGTKISYMEKGIIKNRMDLIDRVRSKSNDCDVIEYFPDIKNDKSILKDVIRGKNNKFISEYK
jgi:hypothetical protein